MHGVTLTAGLVKFHVLIDEVWGVPWGCAFLLSWGTGAEAAGLGRARKGLQGGVSWGLLGVPRGANIPGLVWPT